MLKMRGIFIAASAALAVFLSSGQHHQVNARPLDLQAIQNIQNLMSLAQMDLSADKLKEVNYQELLMKGLSKTDLLSPERLPHEDFNDYVLRKLKKFKNSTNELDLPTWAQQLLDKFIKDSESEEEEYGNKNRNNKKKQKERERKQKKKKDNSLWSKIMATGAEWAFEQVFPVLQTGTVYASRKPADQPIDMTHVPIWNSTVDLQQVFESVRDERYLYTAKEIGYVPPGFKRRIPWLYVNDGSYARADAMIEKIEERSLQAPGKIYIFGQMTLSTHFAYDQRQTDVHLAYHVAPIVIHNNLPYVFDPSVNWTAPLLLQDWVSALTPTNRRLEGVSICTKHTYLWFADQCDYVPPSQTAQPQLSLENKSVGTLVSTLINSKGQSYGVQQIQRKFLNKETEVFSHMCLADNERIDYPMVLGDYPPWKAGLFIVHDDTCSRGESLLHSHGKKRPRPGVPQREQARRERERDGRRRYEDDRHDLGRYRNGRYDEYALDEDYELESNARSRNTNKKPSSSYSDDSFDDHDYGNKYNNRKTTGIGKTGSTSNKATSYSRSSSTANRASTVNRPRATVTTSSRRAAATSYVPNKYYDSDDDYYYYDSEDDFNQNYNYNYNYNTRNSNKKAQVESESIEEKEEKKGWFGRTKTSETEKARKAAEKKAEKERKEKEKQDKKMAKIQEKEEKERAKQQAKEDKKNKKKLKKEQKKKDDKKTNPSKSTSKTSPTQTQPEKTTKKTNDYSYYNDYDYDYDYPFTTNRRYNNYDYGNGYNDYSSWYY